MIKNYYRASLVLSSSFLTSLLTTDASAETRDLSRSWLLGAAAECRGVFGRSYRYLY